MRSLLAAAIFLSSPTVFALPQGVKLERHPMGPVLHLEGAPTKALAQPVPVDGTWAASLRIDDVRHNFTVEIGEFPEGDVRSIRPFLARQSDDGSGAAPVYHGFAFPEVILVFPRWGEDSFYCRVMKVEEKYEGDCEDEGVHLTLKPMSASQPFRFRPVVAHVSMLPAKDGQTGHLLFNSYQTAVKRNSVATIDGTDLLFMNFELMHRRKGSGSGLLGVMDLRRAAEDGGKSVIPLFATKLDGTYAAGRIAIAEKAEIFSASPLVIEMRTPDRRVHLVVSEPEE